MNYQCLFQADHPVLVGLIGAGDFGRSFLFQANRLDSMTIVAICDQDTEMARRAALHSGLTPHEIVVCSKPSEAVNLIDLGKVPILADGAALADLPLDVVVEATGSPEAGATNALAAIQAGKHVVMVSKEAASVIGPILAQKAYEAGVVYTTGDGDQPSLCIGLITWAESIGLEVVCAGKAAESDLVYHADDGTVTNGRQSVSVASSGEWRLWQTPEDHVNDLIAQRGQALSMLPQTSVADYAEMAIVMNNVGYGHDRDELHAPVARLGEIPDLLRHRDDGGILAVTPVIETVNCLRRAGDTGFSGGVFVVVKCTNLEAWELLRAKGHLLSRDGTHAMIYLPYHLLGIETATSVLCAALLGLPTGGTKIRPIAYVVMRATRPMKAGQQLLMNHDHAIDGIHPEYSGPHPVSPKRAIPYYLAAQNALREDVEAGTLITYDMIAEPKDSTIWALKREQDRVFL